MPFSKFDPHRPVEEDPEATSPAAARRVWALRWGWLISQAFFVLGLILMLYWLWKGKQ